MRARAYEKFESPTENSDNGATGILTRDYVAMFWRTGAQVRSSRIINTSRYSGFDALSREIIEFIEVNSQRILQ